ncbi:ribonucleoside triphosphate reductase [Candidatus Parcubacteria bacterium]|nr:MAG: ribonucleoside triphosphate reductase [Candidatus Parcubacteria bacterium]
MEVIKRNGGCVPFDLTKIKVAILKAGRATQEFGESVAATLANQVLQRISQLNVEKIHVEEIQDIVEDVLLDSKFKKTAKAYIIYRDQHMKIREITKQGKLTIVEDYLSKNDWKIKENSNMSFSLQGLNNYISSEISKTYWLYKIYPPEVRDAHINGDLHIHDLNLLAPYCVGWDLMDLLIRGFGGVKEKISSAPPSHFHSALGQVVNFFYTSQGESAGAQAFSNVDTLLAPFIAVDNLSYDEVKRAIRGWVFNLNIPTRVGFQTPFTNITLDLTVPEYLANHPVVIGGKFQDRVYGEFQKEVDMFNRALFEVYLEGDANGRVFTFPIPTINITKDFDWDNPIVDLLFEVTAKYGIPYFANYVNSDLNPEDARSMCCRLRLETTSLKYRGNGLFGSNPLTGSIGVVTLNLARLGFLSKDKQDFFDRLDRLIHIASTSLEIKREVLERFTELGLYPYSKYYLSSVKARTGTYWGNHFSTIGVIGMNEACLNAKFISAPIYTDIGREFAYEVLSFIRDKVENELRESTGHLYNLEATPAEGTSYRLALLDRQRWGTNIITQGNGIPYYTNSSWLPVSYTSDIFTILEHQEPLQCLYTGGTVQHLFLGEYPSPKALKKLLKNIFSCYRIPYISFTPTFSICEDHGYISGEHWHCPTCGKRCDVYSRVVGYLRPVDSWNTGKQEEFKERQYVYC